MLVEQDYSNTMNFYIRPMVSSLLLFTMLFLGAVTTTSNMKLIILNLFCVYSASFF